MDCNGNKEKICDRIKKALSIRGLKQADLVRMTGIGKSSISTYISGAYEPKQQNTYLIARALNVSESWLMGNDVPMERAFPEYDILFGESLKALREARQLSRKKLAELYNEANPAKVFQDEFTEEHIRYLESGQREITYEIAIRFAHILQASPEDILVSWSSAQYEYADMRYKIMSIFDCLNEDGQKRLLSYAEYLSVQSELL